MGFRLATAVTFARSAGGGWYYVYTAAQRSDPFVFRLKRRPDGTTSPDEITPRRIRDYFETNPTFELVDEKLIYRGAYEPGLEVERNQ